MSVIIWILCAAGGIGLIYGANRLANKNAARSKTGAGSFAKAARLLLPWLTRLRYGLLALWDRHFGDEEQQPPPPAVPVPRAAPPPSAPAEPPVAAVPLNGAAVPPDHAALHARIAAFEPEDDTEHIGFIQGEAAAKLGEADAWRAYADTCLHVVGMDPLAAQAAAELADVLADCAHDVQLVGRRYQAIYREVNDAVASGLILPHDARRFLTGEV
jgi:hypothetical protein